MTNNDIIFNLGNMPGYSNLKYANSVVIMLNVNIAILYCLKVRHRQQINVCRRPLNNKICFEDISSISFQLMYFLNSVFIICLT